MVEVKGNYAHFRFYRRAAGDAQIVGDFNRYRTKASITGRIWRYQGMAGHRRGHLPLALIHAHACHDAGTHQSESHATRAVRIG